MPFSLRLKLWLGRVFGWDKDLLKIFLFVVAVFGAGFTYDEVIRPALFPEPPGLTDAQRQEMRDWLQQQIENRR